jgi:hypothetical protein
VIIISSVMRLPVALTILAAALFAAIRGLPFILWPHSAFDADQAIVGLMAKHVAEGRALPLFYYGQPYMLAVQAWLAAPLFVLAGASITMLKLPLLAINAGAAALLVWVLTRDVKLRPLHAFAASGFFILCTPVVGAQLVAAMGGSVEPFLYVLLIWITRHRPVVCGAVAALGFLHREFSIYGLGALFFIDALYGYRQWRRHAVKWAILAAAFLVCLQVVRVARPYGDTFGPELPRLEMPESAPTYYAITTRLACAAPGEVWANTEWLLTDNLPTLLGVTARPRNLYYAGAATPARPLVLVAILLAVVFAMLRMAVLYSRERQAPPAFTVFLLAIAVQSCLFYVSSCDVRGPMLIRYTLLALLAPVAVAAAYLVVEPKWLLRRAAVASLLALMVWHGTGYVVLAAEYASNPPRSPQANVGALLESRGIRYARASYWDAHYINFVTNERVIVAPGLPQRILTYESLVARADRVMYIERNPCPNAEVVEGYWLCMDEDPNRSAGVAIVWFPGRHDVHDFRQQLERKYREGLGRSPVPSSVDVRSATTWIIEYLRYRLSGCDPREAQARVTTQIEGGGVSPACGTLNRANVVPRDELMAYRTQLDAVLHQWAGSGEPTAVDAEGEVVWTQEYVLHRLNGCAHAVAVERVFRQIDGAAAGPPC